MNEKSESGEVVIRWSVERKSKSFSLQLLAAIYLSPILYLLSAWKIMIGQSKLRHSRLEHAFSQRSASLDKYIFGQLKAM